MMRFLAIILLFAHLFSAVGFSMNIHFCGSLKSYAVFGLELGSNCSCDHDGDRHGKDCCKDKKVEVKSVKKENVQGKVLIAKHFPAWVEPVNYFPLEDIYLPKHPFNKVEIKDDPPDDSPPRYILYRTLLI